MRKLKALLCVGMLALSSVVMTGCKDPKAEKESETSSKVVYALECCGKLTINKDNRTFTVTGCDYYTGSGTYTQGGGKAYYFVTDDEHRAVGQISGSTMSIIVQ